MPDCTRDDSTPCDCPSCEAAEDAFWREQEGDPDAPPEEYEFDISDLDDGPEPQALPCPGNDACIGCGGRINAGDLTRLYEEGHVHAGGCPVSREN